MLGVNLRMESPLLFLHLKRLASKNRVYFMSALNVNLLNKDINNISLTFNKFLSFLEGRSIYNRVLLKKVAFHKFLFLINTELAQSVLCKPLLLFFSEIFSRYKVNLHSIPSVVSKKIQQTSQQYRSFTFSVLQRYVGNISLAEMGLYKTSLHSSFLQNISTRQSGLNLYIDDLISIDQQKHNSSNDINVLFTQTIYINQMFNNSALSSNYSLILPFKSQYVEDNEYFFDIFMQQKALVSVKPNTLNEKSFSEIFKSLSTFVTKASNIFLFPSLHTMA